MTLGTLVDEGKSGSTGKNIENGALGTFLKVLRGEVPGKQIKPKTGLTVESFSRLNRLEVDDGLDLFLQIIRGGVALITLRHGRVYTRETLRKDKGQIYQVASEIQAARDLADNISYYSKKAWENSRRGNVSNIVPSWIVKTMNGQPVASVKGIKPSADIVLTLALDPIKGATVLRTFHMALTMGVDAIARTLNAEAVPLLNNRKRKRLIHLWDKGSILKLLRSKSVLGLQQVGHYVEGKRHVKEEWKKAYPAAIDQGLFDRVQAKLDERQQGGPGMGRNVTAMTNLFGDLAQCQCGNRMKVHRRGNHGNNAYLGCSAAYAGGCDNSRFYRLDQIERKVLPRLAAELVYDTLKVDPTEKLTKLIERARKELADIEKQHQRSMQRTGALAERTQAKLEADFEAKQADLRKLQSELGRQQAATPATEAQVAVRGVLDNGLDGAGDTRLHARRIIADALPALLDPPGMPGRWCHDNAWSDQDACRA